MGRQAHLLVGPERACTIGRSREATAPNRSYDEQIVVACGEKLAYEYRRVVSWIWRELCVRTASRCWEIVGC